MNLEEPGFLMLYGHLHPVVLHFPIALLLLAAVLEILPRLRNKNYGPGYANATRIVLVLGALSAIVAATMGLTLAAAGGYEGETVASHKLFGLAVATLALASVGFKFAAQRKSGLQALYGLSLVGAVVAIFVAGHYGGNLTHGASFLPGAAPEPLASWMGEDRLATLKARFNNDSYAAEVEPILEEHCYKCHGPDKQKGKLRLDSKDAVLAGGKSGLPAVEPGDPMASELIRRLFLPRDRKKAMPPDDRARPTDEQIVVLADWIAGGAPFAGETSGSAGFLADYLGENMAPADASAINALRDAGAVVTTLSADNNLLSVDVSLAPVDNEALLDLLGPLSSHIAWLDLGGNNIDSDVIDTIADFSNLTRLSLENTLVNDQMSKPLNDIETLVSLNLTNTRVTTATISNLEPLPFLRTVYVWNTEATAGMLDGVEIVGGSELSLPPPMEEEEMIEGAADGPIDE
jgi:uncharacterized membrane protein